jgi:phosphatidylserine/phosphatidylglycerophosphate/cardiolipin synthase-like enzyme
MSTSLYVGATQTLTDALHSAHDVRLDSYVLYNPRLIEALGAAAERGAHVEITLCTNPGGKGDGAEQNATVMRELQERGAIIHPVARGDADSLHDKTALVDDCLFLDDRNWRGDPAEIVLEDTDPRDVSAAREGRSSTHLTFTKERALKQEAALIANTPGHDILVSTESLGTTAVSAALIARARSGDRVRLLYNPQTPTQSMPQTLRALRDAGVQTRASGRGHKIALVGDRAWIGSANASPRGPRHDWGMNVDASTAAELRRLMENAWEAAAHHSKRA